MKRSTAAALLAIALLAVLMRLLPLLRSLYWGSDFGEYYLLTRALASDGVVPAAYAGWGVTYPWFPGMLVVNGAFVHFGVSPDLAATVVVPLLSGLAVLPMFLLAARVTRDDLAALVAAAFLAVVMFHVYPTSHAVPAALGDLLLLGGLLAFLTVRRNPRAFVPLVLIGLALVVTHHLGTYVLLLACGGALLLRAVLDRKLTLRAIRYEFAFVVLLAVVTIAYWVAYARPFWSLVEGHAPVPATALVLAALLALALVPTVVGLRRRASWRFRPRARSVRTAAGATGLAVATSFAIAGIAIAFPVPGTSIRLEPVHLVLFAPTFLFLSLAAGGRRLMDFSREGTDATAWFLALLASTAFGALAVPEVLIPYRHLEYLAIPVAIFIGAGVRWLSLAGGVRGRTLAVGAVALLVSGTAATAYPGPTVLAGFDEGIRSRTVEAALWVGHHGDGLVAGDHRQSTVLFGVGGLDATWDRETDFWHTTSASDALAAMSAVPLDGTTARVDWILLDEDLLTGVQLSPFAPALPLRPVEEAKFAAAPFQKLFDSGAAQVCFVNWGLAP